MANSSFLSLKYKIMKRLSSKPSGFVSPKDRLDSSLSRAFRPNEHEMRRVFEKLDANSDGKISKSDLKKVLNALGGKLNEAEIAKMVEMADINGDKCIDFKEFMHFHKKEGIRAADIQRAFWMMDLDGDGRIGKEDLYTIMGRVGEECSMEECERMVREVATQQDGLVDMEDFFVLMTRSMELLHV
ncbi:calmodulin-like protein 30 [Aristolochia californica]|uniref:calmodulin-like protein 30 n=1 Tax=Aristolochia californica TaxID=171875 RepID=UPI0035DD433F